MAGEEALQRRAWIQRLGQRQFRQAVEADDLAQQSPEGRLQQIAPLGEERGQAVAVVLQAAGRVVDREAHLRFLPADPQLAEQAHKARIGAIVVDDKSGIDGPGALRRGDIHGGGVAARRGARFEQRYLMVSGQSPGAGQPGDAAADDGKPHTFLDAEVRFGSDAGAGEIIVLRPIGGLVHHPDTLVIPLLVPDAPVVAWWPNEAPANLSNDLLGSMARSRITDAMHSSNPMRTMDDLRRNWSSKNVDMSWTRLTVWRAMLASMLDQPPHLPVSGVRVTGPKNFLPLNLLAAWLRLRLNVPVVVEDDPNATAVTGVYLTRSDGVLSLERPSTDDGIAVLNVPGQSPQTMSVPARTIEECLSEELGRLYPDEIYAEVVTQGWDLINSKH